MAPTAPTPDFTTQLDAILVELVQVVARSFHRHPGHAALALPLAALIRRAGRLALRAFAALAAGRTPHLRAPRPAPRHAAAEAARPRPKSLFPTARAWLVRLIGWPAAGCGSQLAHLLAQPDAAATLAASPAARRALAPIRRMLGISPIPPHRPRPRRPEPRVEPEPRPDRPQSPGWLLERPPGPKRPYWLPPKRRHPPPSCGWAAIRKHGWAASRSPPVGG